jgi:hypothetical protein
LTPCPDRRVAPRLPAVANQTRLEWWEGDHGQQATASLVNLSATGALIRSPDRLPVQMLLWLRLESPARSQWIGARIVRREGQDHAGLAFVEPCPYDFLHAATLGIDLGNLL